MIRKQLLKGAGLTAAFGADGDGRGAWAAANDRIGLGVIGCGNQGTWDQRVFTGPPDVETVALCDVYRPNLRRPDPNHPPRPVEWHHDDRELGYYYTTETFPEYADASLEIPNHARNFINSVKSRGRAIAHIEDGHYTNTVNRLGNIAYRLGRKLHWDAAAEQVVDDPEANRLVVGTYRAPWIPKGL